MARPCASKKKTKNRMDDLHMGHKATVSTMRPRVAKDNFIKPSIEP